MRKFSLSTLDDGKGEARETEGSGTNFIFHHRRRRLD